MLLQSAADAMPKATKWAGPPNAGWGGGNGPLNLARLAKVVDTLEDAGRIPAMATCVERCAFRIETFHGEEGHQTLSRLRTRVAAAQAREAVGGPGSLYRPEHPFNQRCEEFASGLGGLDG